jgi:two-component system response regulator PilR (NtrC family)
VRELENLVERAVALETGDVLTAEHLPVRREHAKATAEEPEFEGAIDLEQAVADLERRLIGAALRRTGGVRKEAAKLLGISFRSLRYRLEKLGIEVGRGDDE